MHNDNHHIGYWPVLKQGEGKHVDYYCIDDSRFMKDGKCNHITPTRFNQIRAEYCGKGISFVEVGQNAPKPEASQPAPRSASQGRRFRSNEVDHGPVEDK